MDSEPDHSLVKSLLAGTNVAQLFAVDGLPATLILDRQGKLSTRLNGYVDKDRFVEGLTERIRDALAQ